MEKSVVISSEAFKQARVEAVDFTRRTGNEFGVILGDEGIIARVPGTVNMVDFETAGWSMDAIPGKWMIHTHPDSSSFSVQDVWVTWAAKAAGASLFGADGSAYTITDLFKGGTEDEVKGYLASVRIFGGVMARGLEAAGFTKDEAQVITGHAMHLKAAKQGAYTYDFELGGKVEAAWAKVGGMI